MTKIKTINTGKAELVLVEVPEKFSNPVLVAHDGINIVYDRANPEPFTKRGFIDITNIWEKGRVEIIGLFPDLTEEQCRQLVESEKGGKYVYYKSCNNFFVHPRPKSALEPYITSQGLNPERTLILRKL